LLLLEKELGSGWGGGGRQRGGWGGHLKVQSMANEPITVGVRLDRITHPTIGLFGGKPGGTAAVSVNGSPVHPKKTLFLKPGDVYAVRCSGGAGYGDPHERPTEAVLRDVKGGYVSTAVAREHYGVALNDVGDNIDDSGTRQLRRRPT